MATTPTARTEVPGKGSFPPFQKETFASQLVWLAITFALLYVLMAKFALPRVGSIFAARRARIDGDIGDANRFKTEAEGALAAYEQSLAEARSRAQTIAAETRDKLNADTEKHRKALEARLNAQLVDAEKQIATSKTRAMTNVRGIAVEAAAAIVSRLIGSPPADGTAASAVDAVLKG